MPAFSLTAAALRFRSAVLLASAVGLLPASASAQDAGLTLRDALERAETGAVQNRTARAASDAASAGRMAAWRSILPTMRVDAGFVRTTDPVGAFGATLRQQSITAADFAPARLNFPAPTDNISGALVLEQPILVLDGWLAARAGARASEGARHTVDWTAATTQAEVIGAWFGVILAAERANTMSAATQAARAHVRQAGAMLEAGLVTKSDVLLAAARSGELDAARLDAVRDSILARRHLTTVLGDGAPALPAVLGSFPDDSLVERTAHDIATLEARPRADIESAQAGSAATDADVGRARATLVPRVVSFVRRDLNSAEQLFGGSSNWTIGVMASWSLFSGAAEIGDRRAAEARRAGAAAQLSGAMAAANVDLERTMLSLESALARLAIARTTVQHASEAHRIVTRKYEGGLATVVELLDAAVAETQAQLGLSAARHALITAIADRLRATGHAPGRLASLGDPMTANR